MCLTLTLVAIHCRQLPKEDTPITDEAQAVKYLQDTNAKLAEQLRIYTEVQWEYATNITETTSAAQVRNRKYRLN